MGMPLSSVNLVQHVLCLFVFLIVLSLFYFKLLFFNTY